MQLCSCAPLEPQAPAALPCPCPPPHIHTHTCPGAVPLTYTLPHCSLPPQQVELPFGGCYLSAIASALDHAGLQALASTLDHAGTQAQASTLDHAGTQGEAALVTSSPPPPPSPLGAYGVLAWPRAGLRGTALLEPEQWKRRRRLQREQEQQRQQRQQRQREQQQEEEQQHEEQQQQQAVLRFPEPWIYSLMQVDRGSRSHRGSGERSGPAAHRAPTPHLLRHPHRQPCLNPSGCYPVPCHNSHTRPHVPSSCPSLSLTHTRHP